jgi:hypothetical protein
VDSHRRPARDRRFPQLARARRLCPADLVVSSFPRKSPELPEFEPCTRLTSPGRDPDTAELSRYSAPPGPRRARITTELRAEVVARYQRGETSRQVSGTCGIAKSTVLAILKSEGIAVRPRGSRY